MLGAQDPTGLDEDCCTKSKGAEWCEGCLYCGGPLFQCMMSMALERGVFPVNLLTGFAGMATLPGSLIAITHDSHYTCTPLHTSDDPFVPASQQNPASQVTNLHRRTD